MNPSRTCKFGAVILAAGESRRMGRQKLLLPWGDSTVIGHIVRQWVCLASLVSAVVRAPADEAGVSIRKELERSGVPRMNQIINPSPDDGMFSSIRVAAAWPFWPETITHVAIVLGDQPHLDLARVIAPTLAAVPRHWDHVVQPSFDSSPKHPVILPRHLFLSLATSTCMTLREVLATMPVSLVPVNDPMAKVDLDTPADYELATRIVFGGKA
jgi:molybdenum cofactor cytidylyltransferase